MNKRKETDGTKKSGRDFSKLNFGLGPRKMKNALDKASLENLGEFNPKRYYEREPALWLLTEILREQTDVTRLNDIEKHHVLLFAQVLQFKVLIEELTIEEAKTYLSHVNCVLGQARGDKLCEVLVNNEMQYFPKTELRIKDRSISFELHMFVLGQVSKEVRLVMQLQRYLGLTFREAALFSHEKAMSFSENMMSMSVMSISEGTVNGRVREVPYNPLEIFWFMGSVDSYQKEKRQQTMIPVNLSFQQFEGEVRRQTKRADPRYDSLGERAYYACEYYYSRMGVRCPSQANIPPGQAHYIYIALKLRISVEEAQRRDNEVRSSLAKCLGQHSASATYIFLG